MNNDNLVYDDGLMIEVDNQCGGVFGHDYQITVDEGDNEIYVCTICGKEKEAD